MGFWDNLKAKAGGMSDGLKTKVSKFKSADFADASMAMCALIAAADGSIDPEERSKTAKFISTSDVLSVFDVSELKGKFDHWCNKLETDFDFGKIEALQVIGKLKRKADQARAVVQVGIIIGGADGDFDDDEKAVVRETCKTLNIPPAEFEL